MLKLLRNILHSPLGVALTFVLFGIIALAFSLGDVVSNINFSGTPNGDRAATVGGNRINITDLTQEADQNFNIARQQNPKLTSRDFVAGGGFDAAAETAFDRVALTTFGTRYGIVAGKRLIDNQLAQIPAAQGTDGKFSTASYQAFLIRYKMSDADMRHRVNTSLVARQLLTPAMFGAAMPADIVNHYAALLKERRTGAVAILPSPAFAPRTKPSDAEITAFYTAHRNVFTLPERRVIRYAIFDAGVIKDSPSAATTPTDADISAYYTAHSADYAAAEIRKVTLLILPDEASARAVVHADGSLVAAAKARGLAVSVLGPLRRDVLAAQTSPEVAAAAFAARAGTTAAPVKSMLGWYVLHVDTVGQQPARSLAQAHSGIAATLATALAAQNQQTMLQNRQAALRDLTGRIDAGFQQGGAITDAAKQLGIPLNQTAPVTANGQIFGKPGATIPKDIAPILATAFTMDRTGSPQLAELQAGKNFVIFDVQQITPAAPAPLADIKNDVATLWALQKGTDAAHAAAIKVLNSVHKGEDLGKALAALGVALPPVQPLSLTRDQLAAMNNRVPQAVGLFFDMAQGTTKILALPDNRGWVVIQLKQDQLGTFAKNDPLLATVAGKLSELVGNEYADELRVAIRQNVGIKRNDAAIAKAKRQMAGGN